jgi:hypothetical protein
LKDKKDVRTFGEWNSAGYRILKDSKCVGFQDGEPLFRADQVTKYKRRLRLSSGKRRVHTEYAHGHAFEGVLQDMYCGSGR